MREIVYNIKSEGFVGSVKIEKPSFSQRMKYVAECNFEFGLNADGSQSIQMNSKNADAIAKMVDYAKTHIKEVEVIHLESEEAAKSFDDLIYDNKFDGVIIEIASMILSGANLGGKKGQG